MPTTGGSTAQGIRGCRMANAEVKITAADGRPVAGREVQISQVSHQFLFGGTGFEILQALDASDPAKQDIARQKAGLLEGLFNTVTLPFYWARFEPQRGRPQTESLKQAAQWCADRRLRTKGHPLCWHTLAPDWLLSMDDAQILQAQTDRIRREVGDFRGLIDTWDAINEAVIMPVFDKYDNGLTRVCKSLGRIHTIRTVFEAARAANPQAVLLINDFDISPAYDILVEGCLEAGLRFDAIGIQSHMHQGYWGPEKTLRVLERFERFNLPIHFTENTIVSGRLMPPEIVDLNDYQTTDWPSTPEGEERQAEQVVTHYKTLLSRPLVAGITWWDFSDGGWLNAPAGLVRQDGSRKPVYDALETLIKGEWWLAPARFGTDAAGRVRFSGFPGEYELECVGKTIPFTLEKPGDCSLNLVL